MSFSDKNSITLKRAKELVAEIRSQLSDEHADEVQQIVDSLAEHNEVLTLAIPYVECKIESGVYKAGAAQQFMARIRAASESVNP